MCDTHIAKIAFLSVIAALFAINFVVVTYSSSTFLNIQLTSLPLGGRPEPKLIGSVDGNQPAGRPVNVSYMEQRVIEAYSKYDYKKAWGGIANDSLPEVFLFPEGIPDQSTTVLIYVYSSPENTGRRKLIRRSWGSREAYSFVPYKFQPYVVFILGISLGIAKNPSTLRSLANESKIHCDMLLFDFADTYRNLTRKGFLALSWIDSHFKNVRYILKTDDDVFLNCYEWLYQVHMMEVGRCELCIYCKIHRVYRRYYPHCKGIGYLMSRPAVRQILSEYKNASWFRAEDVFYTGDLGYQKGIALR